MRRDGDISIIGIAVRILLVVLFVFLLMWFFPMPDLKPLNSGIFNDNVQSMKDAAKSYFTVERMPSKNGESVKLTLKDMINQRMVLPFVDSKNNSCDTEASFVEITKTDSEYLMRVYLSCTDNTDYIIEHIGCYDICPNCKDETTTSTIKKTSTIKRITTKKTTKTALEYQFKKVSNKEVIDKYTCSSGYVVENDKCVKYLDEDKKDAVIEDYTCPSGYEYNKVNKNCEKTITEKTTFDYKCLDSTYALDKETGKCSKDITTDAKVSYSCTNGSLSGSNCIITTTKKECTLVETTGYYETMAGPGNIVKLLYAQNVSYTLCKNTCGQCWFLRYKYNKCTNVETTKSISAMKDYSCAAGTLSGTKCITKQTENATKEYKCSNADYTLNSDKISCSKKIVTTATPVYECEDADYTLIGNSCYRSKSIVEVQKATILYKKITTTEYKWARTKTLAGWIATGKTRTITVKA